QGIRRFVLSVGYQHDVIVRHFGRTYRGAQLIYVTEKTPLGTGGALLLALESVSDPSFLLLNGDTYFEVDLKMLTEFAISNDTDWCFSLFNTAEGNRYMEIEVSPKGQIIRFHSDTNPTDPPSKLASGGVYLVSARGMHS